MFAEKAAHWHVAVGLGALAALLTPLACTRSTSDQTREALPPRELISDPRSVESPESPPSSVVPPGSSNLAPPSAQCEERSFEFRKIVGGCFVDRDLCAEVLSVTFDRAGTATAVTFLGELSTGAEQRAQRVLECVRGHFGQLSSACTKSVSVQFKQSCTLR
jgi:hypothetical protein